MLQCEVCAQPAIDGQVICSDLCADIRLQVFALTKKYAPTDGCDNCWGDLHRGCSTKCKTQFKTAVALSRDLWNLVRMK